MTLTWAELSSSSTEQQHVPELGGGGSWDDVQLQPAAAPAPAPTPATQHTHMEPQPCSFGGLANPGMGHHKVYSNKPM